METKKSLRILIVENNPVDRKMLCGMLEKSSYGSFKLESTDTLAKAFEHLSREKYDSILLDLNLQDCKGLDTLNRVHNKFPELPIVVNTGAYEDALGLKAVTQGAQDYLIKGKYKSYGLSKSLYYAVERRKAEKELEAAYDQLKEMQSQLIQVEKMNVVGSLASGVAHEVKNPLATIMYGVEFLNTKIKKKDEQVKLTLESVKEAAKKANEIVKDLLDFSSLSVLKKEDSGLGDIIDQALVLTKHLCDKHNITVKKEFKNNLPKINVDKNRIEQVIVDILINAILAMKNGGVIKIKAYESEFSKNHVKCVPQPTEIKIGEKIEIIEIDDTGSGINKKDIDKVFDPFFTTRRAAGGVGLGLSIARTIMNNHGGCIYLSNLTEGGTRASLLFKV